MFHLERDTEGDRRSVSSDEESSQGAWVVFSHQFDWEVRLLVGSQEDRVSSQACRTQEEVLSTGEQWKAAMVEKGRTQGNPVLSESECVNESPGR